VVASAPVPPPEPPTNLKQHWTDIKFTVTKGTDLKSGSVQIDPEGKIKQIAKRNKIVKW
jgi:hypothetical protein